jgi:hypothetical protein
MLTKNGIDKDVIYAFALIKLLLLFTTIFLFFPSAIRSENIQLPIEQRSGYLQLSRNTPSKLVMETTCSLNEKVDSNRIFSWSSIEIQESMDGLRTTFDGVRYYSIPLSSNFCISPIEILFDEKSNAMNLSVNKISLFSIPLDKIQFNNNPFWVVNSSLRVQISKVTVETQPYSIENSNLRKFLFITILTISGVNILWISKRLK